MNTFSTWEKNERQKRHRWLLVVIIVLTVIALAVTWIKVTMNSLKRFNDYTFINGIDCSKLTPSEAVQKINQNAEYTITFTVGYIDKNGNFATKNYQANSKDFDLKVRNDDDITKALDNQKSELTRKDIFLIAPKWLKEKIAPNTYHNVYKINIDELFGVNTSKIEEYLRSLPELQEDNMKEPQDAYITVVDNFFEIVPEQKGNKVDISEAVIYAEEFLKQRDSNINLTVITDSLPLLRQEEVDMVSNIDSINRQLKVEITFKFVDGTEIKLDAETLIKWCEKKAGTDWEYEINIEDHLPEFLDLIESKANELNQSITIEVGDQEIKVEVPEKLRTKFDKEYYYGQLIDDLHLKNGTKREYGPSYGEYTQLYGKIQTYIALDIKNQTVWAYKNGKNILKAPCVTGNVAGGHSTPTGIYYLSYKTRNATLRGTNNDGSRYASFVNFWMPFNGGIGFHDASWRHGVFGGEIYKTNGSHGCVNMLYDDARTLYNFIEKDIPIIIY